MADIVRTRAFVTDTHKSDGFARRTERLWAGSRQPPAASIGVATLIDSRLLIEIEVDAIVLDDESA